MKTKQGLGYVRSLAVACLAMTFQMVALRANAGPPAANMVIETSAPGLARLEVMLTSKEWNEPRRFVLEGKDSITGGILLPEKYPAEYSMTAYDSEGNVINTGKGPVPPLAMLDKPLDIPLPSLEKADGLVVSLNRERLVLEVQKSDSPDAIALRADVFDPAGNPAEFDPRDIYWQLSDGRYLDLRHGFDPRDINVVPHKGFELVELCSLSTVVTACRVNGQCRPIKVCSDPWVQVSAGQFHTCALKESGAAFCWGDNLDGQLGASSSNSCYLTSATGGKCSPRPLPVVCQAGAPCRFTQIAAGTTLTAAVDINGDVWWWGRGAATHHRVDAVLAGKQVKFSQVAAGYGHACAISQDRSEIWCWGANGYGETGVAAGPVAPATWEVPDYAPVRVMAPVKFKKIVAAGETSCAIGDTGYDVVCWGRDDSKQVSGSPTSSTVLTHPGTAKFYFHHFGGLTPILDVSASGSGTCVALGWNNGVRCWGDHFFRMVAPFGSPDRIATGGNHICALTNQQAQCMGLNFWGEVGVGDLKPQNAVVNVSSPPTSFATLSAGTSHTCGITPAGEAYCWGRNFEGQIGNGTASYTSWTPTQVTTP